MKTILLALLVTTGCVVGEAGTGGGGGGGEGSGEGGGSGSGANNQGTVDGGTAAACTGAAYDPCTDATQCTSGSCQLFQQVGIQVCTQTCTPGDATTCPMQNGQPQQCNNMGICRPAAANNCTR